MKSTPPPNPMNRREVIRTLLYGLAAVPAAVEAVSAPAFTEETIAGFPYKFYPLKPAQPLNLKELFDALYGIKQECEKTANRDEIQIFVHPGTTPE